MMVYVVYTAQDFQFKDAAPFYEELTAEIFAQNFLLGPMLHGYILLVLVAEKAGRGKKSPQGFRGYTPDFYLQLSNCWWNNLVKENDSRGKKEKHGSANAITKSQSSHYLILKK